VCVCVCVCVVCFSVAYIRTGDVIHVFGHFDASSKLCIVDEKHNMLAVQPDFLLKATHVGSAFQCLRRAVLGELFRNSAIAVDTGSNTDRGAHLLLYGSLIHELFQYALQQNNFSTPVLAAHLDALVMASIVNLYAVGKDLVEAQNELRTYIPSIQTWGKQYFAASQQHEIPVRVGREVSNNRVKVKSVIATEENIWSPKIGLKGMLIMP
jgi:DNA replication ATP-dependent helicase Dna2